MVRNIAKDFQTWSRTERFLFLFGLSFWLFAVSGILLFGGLQDQQALADQTVKAINYKVTLSDTIEMKDTLKTEVGKTDQTVEGVKYKVNLSDSVGTRDNIR